MKIEANTIHISGINVFKVEIKTDEKLLDNMQSIKGFELGLAQKMAHNLGANQMRVRIYIILNGKNENNEAIGLKGEFGISFHFSIENLAAFSKEVNGEIEIYADLAEHLINLAYATSRGIILERTQGTPFNGAILPVINAFQILQAQELKKGNQL